MDLSALFSAFTKVNEDFTQDPARALTSALFVMTIVAGVFHELAEGDLDPEGRSQAVALVRARVRAYLLAQAPEEAGPNDEEELRSVKTALDFFEAQVNQHYPP